MARILVFPVQSRMTLGSTPGRSAGRDFIPKLARRWKSMSNPWRRKEKNPRKLRRGSRLFLLLAGFFVLFGPALAGEIKSLGTFKLWGAYYYTENDAMVCYIASRPIREAGDYTRRGEVFVLVTHRPAAKTRDVVSFQAGFSFQKESGVTIPVDGTE
ncbi:MAG: hypothetical protein J4G10_08125 [Alphaproteobacteria bacterium]|nr:hypothetical protein [Alphaproteobacteria bacterium]